MKKKDKLHAGILLVSLILVPVILWLVVSNVDQSEKKSTRRQMTEGFGQLTRMTYQGKSYVHRANLTSILVLGVDKDTDYEPKGYRSGGQADFLLLIVIDHDSKTIHQLQIDRDTMTDITVLSILGDQSATRMEQICLAHVFGKTEEDRCVNTRKAVEGLLGESVDLYAAIRLDAISAINDALGGVTVTLQDDCSAYDPEMTAGKTLTLHGHQAEIFVRSRYNIADGSNEMRQQRQRLFLTAAADLLREKATNDKNFIGTLYDSLEDTLTTDMNRGRIINEFYYAKDYTLEPVQSFSGEHVLGSDGFVEFHADLNSIQSLVVSLFYEQE